MTPQAMACAAWLIGFTGPMPEYVWINRAPTEAECSAALERERAYFDEAFGPDVVCHAVTKLERDRNSDWTGTATIIGSDKQPFYVYVREGMKAILWQERKPIVSKWIYAVAERWEECPAQ